MSLQILKEMLEDADLFGMIRAGADADVYDRVCVLAFPRFMKDLSIDQIQLILWEAFYEDFCKCSIGSTDEPWALDKKQASPIIGSPERFKGLAMNIRHDIIGL
jgi:hypothetical protein